MKQFAEWKNQLFVGGINIRNNLLTVTMNHSVEKPADVQDVCPSRRGVLKQTSQTAKNRRLQFPKLL